MPCSQRRNHERQAAADQPTLFKTRTKNGCSFGWEPHRSLALKHIEEDESIVTGSSVANCRRDHGSMERNHTAALHEVQQERDVARPVYDLGVFAYEVFI